MADPGADPAIGAGQHSLTADKIGVAYEPLRDEVGMFDKVGAMTDHPGDQRSALGQFHLLEHTPFMLVTRVRGLDREAAGSDPKDQIGNILERDVVVMRAVMTAPADM